MDISKLPEFKLKQFSVSQSDQGMKVSLDALIFAALLDTSFEKALDVGAGTGILSLMLAQKASGLIEAVEIDSLAASICRYNFENSPFRDRLCLHEHSFQEILPKLGSYDMIFSNPPFFKDGMKADQDRRCIARHEDKLSFEDIVRNSKNILSSSGSIMFLMPYSRLEEINNVATNFGFSICDVISIRSRKNKSIKTAVFKIKANGDKCQESEIVVYEGNSNDYTQQVRDLLKDFLLKL